MFASPSQPFVPTKQLFFGTMTSMLHPISCCAESNSDPTPRKLSLLQQRNTTALHSELEAVALSSSSDVASSPRAKFTVVTSQASSESPCRGRRNCPTIVHAMTLSWVASTAPKDSASSKRFFDQCYGRGEAQDAIFLQSTCNPEHWASMKKIASLNLHIAHIVAGHVCNISHLVIGIMWSM